MTEPPDQSASDPSLQYAACSRADAALEKAVGDASPASVDAESMEMVLIEDSGSIASRAKSNCLRLALHAADPTIAGCTAFFGLGTVVLPLLFGRDVGSGSIISDVYSYHATSHRSESFPSSLYNDVELKERFGLVDIEFKMKELKLDAAALDAHIRDTPRSVLKQEVRGIRRWREGANAALKILQRRSAMAYLGLAPSASEIEVTKVYKRLALELHPDKGGDPTKFQVLQTMRQRTVESEKSADQEQEEEDKDIDINVDAEGNHDIAVLRWEAHRSVMQLWDSVQEAVAEIRDVICCLESNVHEVASDLRMFLINFARAEQAGLTNGDALEDRFREMAKMGSEIIGVAALLDPEATHAALITHLSSFFTGSSCSSQVQQEYNALLKSILQVKPLASEMLTAFEVLSSRSQNVDSAAPPTQDEDIAMMEQQTQTPANTEEPPSDSKVESSKLADSEEIRSEHDQVSRHGSRLDEEEEVPKADSQLSDRRCHGNMKVFEKQDNEDVLTFAPPPLQLGSFQMQLRMIDRGSWEELRVDLLEKDEQVGSLHGAYVLRGISKFSETCMEISDHFVSNVAPLFEESGRPVASWRQLLATKSWAGGVVFLEELVMERRAINSAGIDMVRGVMKCLSGPMKRVTLAMCVSAATDGSQLKQLCTQMGFQPVSANSSQCMFSEIGKRPNAAPHRPERKAPGKRKQPSAAAGMENIAPEPPKVKNAKVEPPRKPNDGHKPTMTPVCQVPSSDWDKLTPRNRHVLAVVAAAGSQKLLADADRFVNGKPGGRYWGSESFPVDLRSNVFKAFVKGFADVVSVISTLLRCQKVPNVETISRIISPSAGSLGAELGLHLNKHFVSHFISAGGTVQCALMAVIKEASLFYSAVDSEKIPQPGEENAHRGYHALPVHMLDGDFEFVRSILDPSSSK